MKKEERTDWLRVSDISAYVEHRTGVGVHRTTIYHWIHKGRMAYSGETVKLRVEKRRCIYFTTEEWLDEFLQEFQDG